MAREITRTAASLPGTRAETLINRPSPPTEKSTLARRGIVLTTEKDAIIYVSRTETEQQQHLLVGSRGWEYLYFADRLLHERNAVEKKYRDHLQGHALPSGKAITEIEGPGSLSA